MNKRKTAGNAIWAAIASSVNIIVSFFAQRIFLMMLGAEYLGLNGLFTNIVSMLGIFELGIGFAITFSLYKPLVEDDKPTVKALMAFYKKAYHIIALLVAIVGMGIMPFLPFLIKEGTINVNIYVVYAMFVMDTVCSYLLTYRRSILYADQKNYQINIIHIGYLVVTNTLQLSILAATRNYYLYLSIKIVMRIIENLIIHFIVRRQYPFLNDLGNKKLNKAIEADILKKIKALLFHKIGGYIVLGTDNIIISKFIGLVEVGIYSNYYLIVQAVYSVVGQAISALTPTVGHKLVRERSEDTYDTFKKIRFIGFVMSCIISTSFFCCVQPFVKAWVGDNYLMSTLAVASLTFCMFQRLQRYAYMAFKEAAGIYYEDRFVPLFESLINIIASIALLYYFGVAGVIMGTIISGLTLWCYSFPKYVYKKLFKRSYWSYTKETVGYIVVFLACILLSATITGFIIVDSGYMQIAINAGIALFVSMAAIAIVFHNTSNYCYCIKCVKNILKIKERRKE